MNVLDPLGVVSGLSSNSDTTTIRQEALLTPEQKAMLAQLSEFAKTGKFGSYSAGAGYDGALGNYDMGGLETSAMGKLGTLMNAGTPALMESGNNEIFKTLNTDYYNPMNDQNGIYKGFKAGVMRELADAKSRMGRDMAASGSFFNTSRGRRMGDLEGAATQQLTSKLGDMYDQFVTRKQNAIPMALNAATAGENLAMNRIAAGMQYGGLGRTLADKQAKDLYAEWGRSRSDALTPLDAARSVAGMNFQWGVPEMTVKNPSGPSSFDSLLNVAGSVLPFLI